jgi:hypothetical protein
MSKSFFTIFFLLIIASACNAQEAPIEWGEIPMEDLLMTTFPGDSNASAVILCDYGVSKLDNDINIVFTRHLRIKILNEKGYELGTHSISIYNEGDAEELDDIEAVTYKLDENGEIIENELDDDNIFEEEVSDTRTDYKFTMPALSPGCVIDIKYTIIENSLYYLRDWTFQWEEPVVWSEYRVIMPPQISYAFVSMGYEPWSINENTEVSQTFMGNAAAYLGRNIVTCNQYRWVVKNIPALKDVPYITTLSDYQNSVQTQLAGYAIRGFGTKRVLQDWNTVIKELLDDKNYGDVIDVTGDVDDLTAEITKGLSSPLEKLEAIYNWVTKSIVWDGKQRVFADNEVDDVLEYKKGNSADITFLLLSMLKSAGINGDPMILSTRGNGKIQNLYPIISQFNLTIARVKLGADTYFIDATDPLRPLGQLPEKILNVRALVIKEGPLEWQDIRSDAVDDEKGVVNIQINEDGTLSADAEVRFGIYTSLSFRNDLKDETEIDLAKSIFDTESFGLNLDSVRISNKEDITSPLLVKAWFSSSDFIQQGGNMMYFNPVLLERRKDNPFKAEKREFPVEYAYPRSETIVTNIHFPASFELKEKYDSKNFGMSDFTYKREASDTDGGLQIISKLNIKKSQIKSAHYARLKDFYAHKIAADAEMIVLGPKAAGNESNTIGMKKEGN